MPASNIPNRAVVMQICLGAVYGWSVFVHPLIAAWDLLAGLYLGYGVLNDGRGRPAGAITLSGKR